jgi:hypothetical protein
VTSVLAASQGPLQGELDDGLDRPVMAVSGLRHWRLVATSAYTIRRVELRLIQFRLGIGANRNPSVGRTKISTC